MSDITTLYCQASLLAEQGERVESLDEMTGVQVLERKHPDLPMQPGKVERREFEHVRYGTLSCIFNFDGATGQITAITAETTRTEQDFQRRLAAEPEVPQWHFICDNLNIHVSESLVRYVAAESGFTEDLGIKGRAGILHTRALRATFLSDPARHCLPLHSPARFLDESSGDLAQYSGAQDAPTP